MVAGSRFCLLSLGGTLTLWHFPSEISKQPYVLVQIEYIPRHWVEGFNLYLLYRSYKNFHDSLERNRKILRGTRRESKTKYKEVKGSFFHSGRVSNTLWRFLKFPSFHVNILKSSLLIYHRIHRQISLSFESIANFSWGLEIREMLFLFKARIRDNWIRIHARFHAKLQRPD